MTHSIKANLKVAAAFASLFVIPACMVLLTVLVHQDDYMAFAKKKAEYGHEANDLLKKYTQDGVDVVAELQRNVVTREHDDSSAFTLFMIYAKPGTKHHSPVLALEMLRTAERRANTTARALLSDMHENGCPSLGLKRDLAKKNAYRTVIRTVLEADGVLAKMHNYYIRAFTRDVKMDSRPYCQ